MSGFVYIADSHVGADPIGYYQQVSYTEKVEKVVKGLSDWLHEGHGIDFVLHGGDMIDKTTEDNIEAAVELFADLPVPVYLCLGNHDLTREGSLKFWLDYGDCFFINNRPCYCIDGQRDYVVHVLPSHWCEQLPYFWDLINQKVHYDEEALQELERNLLEHSDKVQFLVTHNPTHGLPVEQTGFTEPYHDPGAEFRAEIMGIVKRHPTLKVVMGAHNHMNLCAQQEGVHFVTVSAFTEVPFEFKHFRIEQGIVGMQTLNVSERIDFKFDYDFNKTYVQGRPVDRKF